MNAAAFAVMRGHKYVKEILRIFLALTFRPMYYLC